MERIVSDQYFSSIAIPDDFNSLEEFAQWFVDARMPIRPPMDNARVIVTDNATAVPIFRKGRYQIELYIQHPNTSIKEHSHPGMDVVLMQLGNFNGHVDTWGAFGEVLLSGNSHGGVEFTESGEGSVFLAFEKWHEGVKITSAATQWEGETHGPVQDELIRRYNT